MDIDVVTISDDACIRDIFRYTRWTVDGGIDYLVGIHEVKELDGVHEVTTLDGKVYREPEHAKEIHELFKRVDRVRALWDHGIRKGIEYHPAIFIRWGLRYRDAAKLDWLSDAQNHNLVPHGIEKPKDKSEKELTPTERKALLKIIAGLCNKAYKSPPDKFGLQKQIMGVIEGCGLKISGNTLSGHLHAAARVLLDEGTQQKPQ